MPADRANDQEVFLTLEDVMKEKCLDHVTTMVGLDEKTIEEDFKAVDTDEDGKLTLEEGLKVYQYLRETADSTSYGMCVYDCCYKHSGLSEFLLSIESQQCNEIKEGPEPIDGGCEAKTETPLQTSLTGLNPVHIMGQLDCTLKATAACKEDGDCITIPYSIENGEEEVGFFQG